MARAGKHKAAALAKKSAGLKTTTAAAPNVCFPDDKAEAPAKRPARTKTFQARRFSDVPPAVYSISSFCVAHGISEAFYHQLQNSGRGPRELRLGNRVLITPAAADAWLAAMEKEAATAAE